MADTIPPLGRPTKLLYGIGSVAYGIKDIAFRSFLLIYYNQVIGVRADLVSAAIMAALVVDAISDPIVGQFSDNLRTKWGRRHPLMYAAVIPAAGSFLLLWFPPTGLSDFQMFFYILVVSCFVRTLITFYEIPSSALAAELTSDYDERTTIAALRFSFGTAGAFLVTFVTLRYFLVPTEDYPVGQLNPMGYELFGLLGAAVMVMSMVLSTTGTHSRIRYLRKSPPREKIGLGGMFKRMAESYAHLGFMAILMFGLLKYTAIGMSGALLFYFATYFWEFTAAQLSILVIDTLVAAFASLAIAPAVSKRMGKRNAAFLFATLAVITMAAPYVLRLNGLFLPNGHPMLLPTIFVLQTIYYTCGLSSSILVHAMIGDIVEDSALRTGRRTEGQFFSANTFMQKSISGLGLVTAGLMLTYVSFPQGLAPGEPGTEAINDLVMVFLPGFAICYFGAGCALFFYRIDREGHAANVAELQRRDSALAAEEEPFDKDVL